ncbi:MAG: nucleotide exchange factor GrpE [Spirochaetes bacterium]|nr:nucleotide exchange factor GrpE [Spirochaetota bacterium]
MSKQDTHPEKPDQGNLQTEAENSQNVGESAQNQAENGSEQPVELTPEEKIAELEAQLAETRDQLLRKAADFENFRKRMNQEKQSAIEYANQSLLLDIIPIIDDFERAIFAGENSTDIALFLDGIKMIEKRLSSQLESKWGLKRYNSAGEPFDPNLHEALMVEKSPDISEPIVQEDISKGYMLKERVIRAAKVKVLMPENTEKEGA